MNIGILGAGITGSQSAVSAKKLGYNVYLSDTKNRKDISKSILDVLEKNGIELELGKNSLDFFADCERIILSPGIPENDFIKLLKSKGKEMISDIDFAYEHIKNAKWIGITGTNGKTTTTALLGEIFKTEYKTFIGGNIGESPTKAIGENFEIFIIEMSSYQLDISKKVRFDSSLILNITEDHLNRYNTMDNYIHSKLKILKLTKSTCFINSDNGILKTIQGENVIKFGLKHTEDQKVIYNKKDKILSINGESISVNELTLIGIHNIYNIMGASFLALDEGITNKNIFHILRTFKPLPHRIELVKEVNGMKIYNDSKSTTPDSTYFALKAFENKRVFLILGGSDEKHSDFTILDHILKSDNIFTYIVGKGADYILKQLNGKNILGPMTIEKSIQLVFEKGKKDDILLFSPGCPSFDRFKNYKERGEFFKKIINER